MKSREPTRDKETWLIADGVKYHNTVKIEDVRVKQDIKPCPASYHQKRAYSLSCPSYLRPSNRFIVLSQKN